MKIEEFTLAKDVPVFYVKAKSFPEGIEQAFHQLHKLVSDPENRQYYGLSRPNQQGTIEYFAAVQEVKKNEGKELGCETIVIRHGKYTSTVIRDFHKKMMDIQSAFDKLLKDPKIDPQGYCVEMYLADKDVRCMVRLED